MIMDTKFILIKKQKYPYFSPSKYLLRNVCHLDSSDSLTQFLIPKHRAENRIIT